jgi:hypothetical protein
MASGRPTVCKLYQVRSLVTGKDKNYHLVRIFGFHFFDRGWIVSIAKFTWGQEEPCQPQLDHRHGKTALHEPWSSLEDTATICHPVFASFDLAAVIFSQSKAVSLASNPQPGGPGPCIYISQWQGGPIIITGYLGV